jgi:hypothetical protein
LGFLIPNEDNTHIDDMINLANNFKRKQHALDPAAELTQLQNTVM